MYKSWNWVKKKQKYCGAKKAWFDTKKLFSWQYKSMSTWQHWYKLFLQINERPCKNTVNNKWDLQQPMRLRISSNYIILQFPLMWDSSIVKVTATVNNGYCTLCWLGGTKNKVRSWKRKCFWSYIPKAKKFAEPLFQ